MSNVISDMDELNRKLQALQRDVPGGMGTALLAGALVLEGSIKQSMQDGHSGRVYRRGNQLHQASAPGETPAIDYGNYLGSFSSERLNENTAQVSTNAEYGPALEFGSGHIAARPHIRKAADEHEEQIVAAVRVNVVRLVDEASK